MHFSVDEYNVSNKARRNKKLGKTCAELEEYHKSMLLVDQVQTPMIFKTQLTLFSNVIKTKWKTQIFRTTDKFLGAIMFKTEVINKSLVG